MKLKQKIMDHYTEHEITLPCKIGRDPLNDMQLISPLVSREHCEVFERDGKVWIRDQPSANGTYVNYKRIWEVTELKSGDILKLAFTEFEVV